MRIRSYCLFFSKERDWTEDEDAQLRAVVETLGENNWQAVATALGGRTGPQCSNRSVAFSLRSCMALLFHIILVSKVLSSSW